MKAPKILLFLLTFCLTYALKAQTNFQKGYYISNDQDTVRGYIEYRSERRNYQKCVFKTDLDARPVQLSAHDIRGYTIQDKISYETHAFTSRKKNAGKLFGFFRLLMRGKLSLYQFDDRFFASDSSHTMIEISKQNIRTNDNKIKSVYEGLGNLIVLMQDCPEMTPDYLTMKYQRSARFVEIFKQYNACVGDRPLEATPIHIKPHVNFGLQAGPGATRLILSGSLKDVPFGYDVNYTIGGFVSIFVPRVNENVRFVIEANYGRYNHYSYFSENSDTYRNNDLFINYSFVKIPLLIRYSYGKFFVDAGVQWQMLLNQNIKWRIETIYQNVVSTTEAAVTPLPKQSFGCVLDAGIRYKLGGYSFRSVFRFSQTKMKEHPDTPIAQTMEILLAFQPGR
jgi:hypothetical protein